MAKCHGASPGRVLSARFSRTRLIGMAKESDGRVAILTPGPLNENLLRACLHRRAIFGIMLLEGDDLTVLWRAG